MLGEFERNGLALGQAFLILLVLGGLFVTLFGLSQFIYREETVIDAETVRWSRYGLRGAQKWERPLSDYRGVLKGYQYRSSDDHPGTSHMEYRLSLHHDEPSKRVLLYESENYMVYPPGEWNRLWTHYGELFRLPVLESTPQGIASSTVEDLSRPLLDKVAEGKIRIPKKIDLDRPRLPAGLSLHRDDDLWVITLKPMGNIWKIAFLLLMAMAVLGIGIVFYIFPRSLPGFLLMSVFAAALLAGAVHYIVYTARSLGHPDQVAVDARTLWRRTWDRRRTGWDTHSMPIAGIISIDLKAEPAFNSPGEQVVVEGRQGRLEFGAPLTDRARRRLRDILLFLVCSTGDGETSAPLRERAIATRGTADALEGFMQKRE